MIVLVQLRRVLREVRRTGRSGELLPSLLPLCSGLAAQELGETLGYLRAKPGGASERRMSMELDRSRHVRKV